MRLTFALLVLMGMSPAADTPKADDKPQLSKDQQIKLLQDEKAYLLAFQAFLPYQPLQQRAQQAFDLVQADKKAFDESLKVDTKKWELNLDTGIYDPLPEKAKTTGDSSPVVQGNQGKVEIKK